MICVLRSNMKHPLILAAILCLYFAGSHAVDLAATLNGGLLVNGSADIRLNVSYPIKNGNQHKDVNVTLDQTKQLNVSEAEVSGGRSITILYHLSNPSVESMVIDMRKMGELFYIHQVNFTLKFTKAEMPNLENALEGETLVVYTNVRPKFQTPIGNVFKCKTTIPMGLTNDSKLTFTNTEFRSFDNTSNWMTVSREVCPRDFESKADVRIATGSAFAALIVAAIVGAVVLNCKKGDEE